MAQRKQRLHPRLRDSGQNQADLLPDARSDAAQDPQQLLAGQQEADQQQEAELQEGIDLQQEAAQQQEQHAGDAQVEHTSFALASKVPLAYTLKHAVNTRDPGGAIP